MRGRLNDGVAQYLCINRDASALRQRAHLRAERAECSPKRLREELRLLERRANALASFTNTVTTLSGVDELRVAQ
jgi:hypothetical protein